MCHDGHVEVKDVRSWLKNLVGTSGFSVERPEGLRVATGSFRLGKARREGKRVWWLILVVPALGRQRLNVPQLQTSPSFLGEAKLVCTYQDLVSGRET